MNYNYSQNLINHFHSPTFNIFLEFFFCFYREDLTINWLYNFFLVLCTRERRHIIKTRYFEFQINFADFKQVSICFASACQQQNNVKKLKRAPEKMTKNFLKLDYPEKFINKAIKSIPNRTISKQSIHSRSDTFCVIN